MTNYEAITKNKQTLSDFIFSLISHCDERCTDCILKPSALDYTPKGIDEWLDMEKDFEFPKPEKGQLFDEDEDEDGDEYFTFDDLIEAFKKKGESKEQTFANLLHTLKDTDEDEDEYEDEDEEDPRAIIGSAEIKIDKTGCGVYANIDTNGKLNAFELVGILEDMKHDILHPEDD